MRQTRLCPLPSDGPRFCCPVCLRVCANAGALATHRKSHSAAAATLPPDVELSAPDVAGGAMEGEAVDMMHEEEGETVEMMPEEEGAAVKLRKDGRPDGRARNRGACKRRRRSVAEKSVLADTASSLDPGVPWATLCRDEGVHPIVLHRVIAATKKGRKFDPKERSKVHDRKAWVRKRPWHSELLAFNAAVFRRIRKARRAREQVNLGEIIWHGGRHVRKVIAACWLLIDWTCSRI